MDYITKTFFNNEKYKELLEEIDTEAMVNLAKADMSKSDHVNFMKIVEHSAKWTQDLKGNDMARRCEIFMGYVMIGLEKNEIKWEKLSFGVLNDVKPDYWDFSDRGYKYFASSKQDNFYYHAYLFAR